MLFKNAIPYRLTEALGFTVEQLQEKLTEQTFTPCKSQELSRYGWVAPCPHDEAIAYAKHDFIMIAAKKEEKILPTQVIKDAVAQKVAEIQKGESRRVYKKEKDQLRDEVILDLLPRAFSRHQLTKAIIHPATNLIIVEATSFKRAEELLSYLRGTLGTLPLSLLDVTQSPSAVMSHWLEQPDTQPECFQALDSCRLKDNVQEGGEINVKHQALADEEFIAHLEAGKRITELHTEWEETLTFKLTDDLRIKSIKPTDQTQEQRAEATAEDEVAQFESDLFFMGTTFTKLINAITTAFGGIAERP